MMINHATRGGVSIALSHIENVMTLFFGFFLAKNADGLH